jgi:hypothetical protein
VSVVGCIVCTTTRSCGCASPALCNPAMAHQPTWQLTREERRELARERHQTKWGKFARNQIRSPVPVLPRPAHQRRGRVLGSMRRGMVADRADRERRAVHVGKGAAAATPPAAARQIRTRFTRPAAWPSPRAGRCHGSDERRPRSPQRQPACRSDLPRLAPSSSALPSFCRHCCSTCCSSSRGQ